VTLDCDLNDRSHYVWEISLDAPTSDNSNDDEVVVAETNTEDDLDNMLSPYNVPQLQDSCQDCQVFRDYFRDGILPSDDAEAHKVVYLSEIRFARRNFVVLGLATTA